jgi:CubicO group peptidase (beta-lactamase class C family)
MQDEIAALMRAADVPGFAMLILREGREEIITSGITSRATAEPVTSRTVFQAASLSKPVVAHAALQLAGNGVLDLDQPLSQIVAPLIPDDPHAAAITARHVLSHRTGLPNWRREEYPLRSYFSPGARFSYSGEGFVYLQHALEHVTREPLDALIQRLVFDPLGMRQSSFLWRSDFAPHVADAHDAERVLERFMPRQANAAYSLLTTAPDYGRFLAASLDGRLLTPAMARQWMTPEIRVPLKRTEALESEGPELEEDVAWGLGWGLEPQAGSFFHWGANSGARAFAMAMPARRSALVMFMNEESGLCLAPSIVQSILPGKHPSLSWLELTSVTGSA